MRKQSLTDSIKSATEDAGMAKKCISEAEEAKSIANETWRRLSRVSQRTSSRWRIQELIDRRVAEAAADATEKEYHDSEMAKAEKKKTELEDDATRPTAKIEKELAVHQGTHFGKIVTRLFLAKA